MIDFDINFKHYLQSNVLEPNITEKDLLDYLGSLSGRFLAIDIMEKSEIIISRPLTSGEMSQTLEILRFNGLGQSYQEAVLTVFNSLLSSHISWLEFMSEQREV